MVCQFEITEEQLLAALEAIKDCKDRGFSDTTAIFHISSVKPNGTDTKASFSGNVILKAHPTDYRKNWGNNSLVTMKFYKYEDGECKLVEE